MQNVQKTIQYIQPHVRRTRLPGTSKTPMWLFFSGMQLLLYAVVVVILMSFPHLTYYEVAGMLAGILIITTAAMHVVAGSRISRLALMLTQDPQVIVGDPRCVQTLSKIPWYGLSEIDNLQLAVFQTYNAYAVEKKHAGEAAKVSHAEGEGDGSEFEWLSAEADDEDEERAAKDALTEYLLSQENRRPANRIKRMFTRQAQSRSSRKSGASLYSAQSGGSGEQSCSVPMSANQSLSRTARSVRSVRSMYTAQSSDGGVADRLSGDDFPTQQGTTPEESGLSHNNTMRKHLQEGDTKTYGSLSATPRKMQSQDREGPPTTSGRSSPAPVPTTYADTSAAYDPLNDNKAPWDILKLGIKDPGGSLLIQLLSQVKVGQPLSAVTLPVHILESRSLLERLSDLCIHWDFLIPLVKGDIRDKYERLVAVFKFFIAAYRMKPIGARKPYNPILGEVLHAIFKPLGLFPLTGSDSPKKPSGSAAVDGLECIVEQVSHHPPISAIYGRYKDLIEIQGVYHPKSKLVSLNCAASIGEGSVTLKIIPTSDTYTITFPSFFASGIVRGDPRLELGGTVTITDNDTKVQAKVEFLRKAWLSGEYDKMECQVFGEDGKPNPKYKFSGTWFDVIYNDVTKQPFHDPHTVAHLAQRPVVVDTPGHPKQSRAVWKDLTVALRRGDSAASAAAKLHVESAQRAERKQLAAAGIEHIPRFFRYIGKQSGKEKDKSLPEVTTTGGATAAATAAAADTEAAAASALAFKNSSDSDKYNVENWIFVGQTSLITTSV